MISSEVVTDLFDEIASVMFDCPTRATHEVELVIGMCEFPSGCPGLCPEARFAGDSQFGEQRQ